jgi:FtsP/CotA-like multicopper oxidase with cupredoxin domain
MSFILDIHFIRKSMYPGVSKNIYQKWVVTAGTRSPDGVEKRVYLINDQFPGPVVEGRPGDTIVVDLKNELEGDEGVSLHFHGLHMRGQYCSVDDMIEDAN